MSLDLSNGIETAYRKGLESSANTTTDICNSGVPLGSTLRKFVNENLENECCLYILTQKSVTQCMVPSLFFSLPLQEDLVKIFISLKIVQIFTIQAPYYLV